MYDDHTHLKKVPFVCFPSRICLIINRFAYQFQKKSSIFSSRQREISIRRVLLKFAKTRSQNVNHSFRIFFFKWVYHFFPLYIGWFVCFVFVRPVVALIRLLTNECLLLTHITSSPRLAGAEGSPSRGPRRAAATSGYIY